MSLLDSINLKFSDKYDFLRVSSAKFDKSSYELKINFLFPSVLPEGKSFNASDKEAVTSFIKENYPQLSVLVFYSKSYCDKKRLTDGLFQYINTYKSFASFYIKKEDLAVSFDVNDGFEAVLSVEPHIAERFENEGFVSDALKYLGLFFCEKIDLKLARKESDSEINLDVEFDEDEYADYVSEQKKKKIKVEVLSAVVGAKITEMPTQIKYSTSLIDKVYVCGKIMTKTRSVSKMKGFPFYIMSINDGTDTIIVKSFSKDTKDTKVTGLDLGAEIICTGRLVEDEYEKRRDPAHGMVMLASRISTCKIDYTSIDTSPVYRSCPVRYKYVKPEKYQDSEQADFFSARTIPEELIGTRYMIFDLETTGLSLSDQICEIGACKVENGVITETFQTLVKPSIPMPAEATKVNNITDEMLENQLPLEEIFPDFYKFCQGCILVSYNTEFDVPFIKKACGEYNFKFDYKVEDALPLAKRKLSLNNYKLKTVVDNLDISLVNAHRALADTLATAKAFIKLKGMPDK